MPFAKHTLADYAADILQRLGGLHFAAGDLEDEYDGLVQEACCFYAEALEERYELYSTRANEEAMGE